MKFKKITVTILLTVLALVVVGLYFYYRGEIKSSIFKDGSVYVDSESLLSFSYPDNLNVSSVKDADGEVILLKTSEKGVVIQIFISPGEEGIVITPEIVKADIPELKDVEMKAVEVGSSRKGVLFSDSEGAGIKNLWFAEGNKLFQVTFYEDFEKVVFLMGESLSIKK
ncbi:MAG: hypothetical protein RJA61_12 [Candidatus Parcubacteria bacterium]|jgi:hypothetical protein